MMIILKLQLVRRLGGRIGNEGCERENLFYLFYLFCFVFV